MTEKAKSLVQSFKDVPRSKKLAVAAGVGLVAVGVAGVVLNKKMGALVEAAVSETP